jgi:sec-independent protein translocase protein TatA
VESLSMFESPWHWLVVAIVAFVLFFGWKQLPDMARSVGRSLRIFKTEMKGMTQDDEKREKAAEPEAPRALPAAEVVRNDAVPTEPARSESARPRPRPTPAGSAEAPRRADAS